MLLVEWIKSILSRKLLQDDYIALYFETIYLFINYKYL